MNEPPDRPVDPEAPTPESTERLSDFRASVDAIDDRILELLEQRAQLMGDIRDAKRAAGLVTPYDPARERIVLDRLAARASGTLRPEAVRAVFREVMSACLALQQPITVAFLGPEGTFTHMAARRRFGLAARYRDVTTIEGVFDAVVRKEASFGVVPIENSTEGAVTATLDALLDGRVRIQAELVESIAHALLSFAPSLADVERVYSHPQALAQCRGWLLRNLPSAQLVHATSTAAAAREAAADSRGAAIASTLAGELVGLPVLAPRIQDRDENATRFVVLATEDARPTGRDKTTIAFALRHEPGALRRALEAFEAESINIWRIESRPSRTRAWEYVFLCDVSGHREDADVKAALARLGAYAADVLLLGSYPRHGEGA